MESRYTMETLPQPVDPRIRIRENPPRTIAALRFSGSWSGGNYERHEKELVAELEARDLEIVGEPIFARYNSPFKPWFLRRNEILIEVSRPET